MTSTSAVFMVLRVKPQFELYGVPVAVQINFVITAILLGMHPIRSAAPVLWLSWVATVFFGVLVHEMGHALVGRRFGLDPYIVLSWGGGYTAWSSGRALNTAQSIAVSFAGPAVGLVLGGLVRGAVMAGAFRNSSPIVQMMASDFVWVNWGWAFFNLLPILPLDGGRILESISTHVGGTGGRRFAILFSIVFAAGLAILEIQPKLFEVPFLPFPLGGGNYFMAIFAGLFAYQNYQLYQLEARFVNKLNQGATRHAQPNGGKSNQTRQPAERKAPTISEEIEFAFSELEAKRPAVVRAIAERLLRKAETEDQRVDLVHLAAWGRLSMGDIGGAKAVLEMLPQNIQADVFLEGSIALEAEKSTKAVELLAEALRTRDSNEVAEKLARACIRANSFEAVHRLMEATEALSSIEPHAFHLIAERAFQKEMFHDAKRIHQRLFDVQANGHDAYNLACIDAKLGDLEGAFAWLEKSVELGVPNLANLSDDPDLQALRNDSRFAPLEERALRSGF